MEQASGEPSSQSPQAAFSRRRNEDEEALRVAIEESLQRDIFAELIQAEEEQRSRGQPRRQAGGKAQQASAADVFIREALDAATASPLLHGDMLTENIARISLGNHSIEDDKDFEDSGSQEDRTSDSRESENEEEGEEKVYPDIVLDRVPPDVLLALLLYLDADSIAHCAMVARRWHKAAIEEKIYENLCRRTYTVQARQATRMLALRKWKTWRAMFIERPRLRPNGFYFLKVSYIKKPEHSMWSEIPRGTILETIYYRYFVFGRDGSVKYLMSFRPPKEASAMFINNSQEIAKGIYSVEKTNVHVAVSMPHAMVEFRFRLYGSGRGKYNRLELLEHTSTSRTSSYPVNHKVNYEEFKFYRIWHL